MEMNDALPTGSSGKQPEEEPKASPEDVLKSLLESGDEQTASRLSDLLADLQPQADQPDLETSRAGAAAESGLNLAGLLRAPGLRDTLLKLLAEKLNLPASSVEALVGMLGKEKKKTKKKASPKTAKKRKTSAAKAKKKATTSSKKKTTAKSAKARKTAPTARKPKSKKAASKKTASSTAAKKRRAAKKKGSRSVEIE